MKILYITEIFPDPRTGLGYWGGGERQFYEVARRAAKRGHEVTVLTCRFPGQAPSDVLQGMKVTRQGLSRDPRTGGALLSLPKVVAYVAKTVSAAMKVDADIIHCNAYFPVVAGRIAAALKGVPMVSTFHDLPAPEAWFAYSRSFLWSRLGYVATVASAKVAGGSIVAVSENARAKLAKAARGVVQVIPNGVDSELLDSTGTMKAENQILYVGRLVQYKKVDVLISAFGEAATEIGTARLVIVGDGPERRKLEGLASRLAHGKVVFTGTLPSHESVAEFYRKSTVFVLPSVLEGESIVLKEAMAAGLPVIAMRVKGSGVLNIVEDGVNGLLVAPDDPHGLAEVLKRLLLDRRLREAMGARGRSMAEKWTWDEVTATVLEVYAEAVHGGTPPRKS